MQTIFNYLLLGFKSKSQVKVPLNYTDKCIFKHSCFLLNKPKHNTFDFPLYYSSFMLFVTMVLLYDKTDDMQVFKYYAPTSKIYITENNRI